MAVKITTREDIEANGGNLYDVVFDGTTVNVVEFDSLSRFAAFDYSAKVGGSWTYGPWREFHGVEAAQNAALNGECPEQVLEQYRRLCESLEAEVQELVARMPSAKRQRKYGIEGSELSTERVMVHDTDVWERRVRGAKRQTVRIFINFSYHANDGPQSFINGVVRGIALADVLSTLGHTVEITACSFSQNSELKVHHALIAPLKLAEQRLDPQQLLTLALPSYQRVFKWGIWEVFQRKVSYHIGNAQVTQHYVDHFGIDVFATGSMLSFNGDPDTPEGKHIAEAVECINLAEWVRG